MARKRNKKWLAEVDDEYLRKTREGTPQQRIDHRKALAQARRRTAKLESRYRHIRRGVLADNGDKWGNSWLLRKRFLEGKIEVSERAVRAKRMLNGQPRLTRWSPELLAAVRSVGWPSALRYLAARMKGELPVTSMKSSPAGKDDNT